MRDFTLRIKGRREALHTDDAELLNDWKLFQEDKGGDAIVTIGNWTGHLSSILDFTEEPTTKMGKSFDYIYDIERAEVKRKRDMSPVDRAKEMGFFRWLYWGFTKQDSRGVALPNGTPIEELAEKLQAHFFSEHPLRIWPDPDIFKNIIKSTSCDGAVLRVIENIIRVDYANEKYAKLSTPGFTI